jgi:hypothetical protein
VLPLAPDYVIFYDGANQLGGARSFIGAAADSVRRYALTEVLNGRSLLPDSWTEYSRLAKVVNDTYRLYVGPALDDWRRPSYELRFPAGIDEAKPDIDSPECRWVFRSFCVTSGP